MPISREQTFVQALDAAINKGIKIWPGATFDWTIPPTHTTNIPFKLPVNSGHKPSACNVMGALLVELGYLDDKSVSMRDIGKLLDVSGFWLYKFHIGFNKNRQIMIKYQDKKSKKEKKKPDKVSMLGRKLRKKYIGW